MFLFQISSWVAPLSPLTLSFGLISMRPPLTTLVNTTACYTPRPNTHTPGEYHVTVGMDWSDRPTDKDCQGLPTTTRSQGEAKKEISPRTFRESMAQLTPRLQRTPLPELWGNQFLLFWATRFVVLGYGSSSELIEKRKQKVLPRPMIVTMNWCYQDK